MLDRTVKQSHHITMRCARAVVEAYEPLHRLETDHARQSAPAAWKLTRHREYQSSLGSAWLSELRVPARHRQCGNEAMTIVLPKVSL
jgi:hypothetical protein